MWDPGLRWMFSDVDLLQRFQVLHLRLGIWNCHLSWTLTLPLYWDFGRGVQIRPSEPILQYLRSISLLSRFPPRVAHVQGISLTRLLIKIDVISIFFLLKWGSLFYRMTFRTVFHTMFCHQTKDPEYFVDDSSISWIPPSFFVPAWLKQYRRCPFRDFAHYPLRNPISLRSVWCEHTMILILHRTYQILRNFQLKWLLTTSSSPVESRDFSTIFWISWKVFVYTRKIVITELNLVSQQRIDDFYVIQFLRWKLCDP